MHWDAYTVFSVISGVVLVIMGIVARLSVKERLYAFVGGVIFAGYGIYVAKQTSGTYFFSVWVFVIPVIAIGYLIAAAVGANKSRATGSAPGAVAARPPHDPAAAARPQHGSAAAAAAPPGPVTRAAAPPLTERPAEWSSRPAQPFPAQPPAAQPAVAQPAPPGLLSAPAITGRIFCTQCGTQGVPGGSFCGECGAPMVSGTMS